MFDSLLCVKCVWDLPVDVSFQLLCGLGTSLAGTDHLLIIIIMPVDTECVNMLSVRPERIGGQRPYTWVRSELLLTPSPASADAAAPRGAVPTGRRKGAGDVSRCRWMMMLARLKGKTAFSAMIDVLRPSSAAAVAAVGFSIWLIACGSGATVPEACVDNDRELRLGFYAYFAPVSHSADGEEGSPGFDVHRGYEADLLTALEAMDGAGVSFSRRGIGSWDDIWLASAGPEFDVIGGGITILDSRTRDAQGREAVVFTSGHIAFRQSLLMRVGEESRFTDYDDLTSDVRVGALAGTTGEARLLELTGLTNSDGVLAAGVIIETPRGEVVADGASTYRITAAAASENLAGRSRIRPAADDMPEVVYLGGQLGETELIAALSDGRIDALARGEVGNREAERASGNAFVVGLLDEAVERGGFTFDVEDAALAACLSDRIDFLTDEMTIGYADWLRDPSVFMRRAEMWNSRQ